MGTRYINPALIRELLHYNPKTGVFTWLPRPSRYFKSVRASRSWNSRYAGTTAGSLMKYPCGYRKAEIGIFNVTYPAHRVAWVYMTGEQPPECVDHESRDATDNRWNNLRLGDGRNSLNLSRFRNNKSGVAGVCWDKRYGKWRARVNLRGKEHYLGYFKDLDIAAMEVLEFRAEHGFDPQHGLHSAPYHRDRDVSRSVQNA